MAKSRRTCTYKRLLLVGIFITVTLQFFPSVLERFSQVIEENVIRAQEGDSSAIYKHYESDNLPTFTVEKDVVETPTERDCTYYTCFDVRKCHSGLKVFVYNPVRFVDDDGALLSDALSKEYIDLMETVIASKYYTGDPDKACLFIPPIDTLNQNKMDTKTIGRLLASLPFWNNGTNHAIFNMLPGVPPDFNTTLDVAVGRAVLLGGGSSVLHHRAGFDASIPVFNPWTAAGPTWHGQPGSLRDVFLLSAQVGIHKEYRRLLERFAAQDSRVLVLDGCEQSEKLHPRLRCRGPRRYDYPDVLESATFCTVFRRGRLGQPALSDVMRAGCVPVIVADNYVLPFSDVLDWRRASVQVYEAQLPDLMRILQVLPEARVTSLQRHARFFWRRYMRDIPAITKTSLKMLDDRMSSHTARSYEAWNDPPQERWRQPPLFMPLLPGRVMGFTAVILAYSRPEALLTQLSHVRSLKRVVIVWNHPDKDPPTAASFSGVNKPIRVVTPKTSSFSNRFIMFEEIETDCVLGLNDDRMPMTPDEVEFGFQVWRTNSDRLVGFAGRREGWGNSSHTWHYISEWSSEVSVVLTGAAFYHKYYGYLYHHRLPKSIRSWIDEKNSCEDLAMNFLIANVSRKAPIKVTPRQKFRCSSCGQGESVAPDKGYMEERSGCVNRLVKEFGYMPLQSVDFRVDPVLFKTKHPGFMSKYSDTGEL